MARIPYVDPEKAPPEVREVFEKLPAKLNVFRMMANATTNFRPLIALGTSILARQELLARLREIAILRVARLSKAEYEWIQHVAIAQAVGVSAEQVAALERGDAAASCFGADERLVLDFTDEVVRDVRASDATFQKVVERFGPRQMAELLLAIGYYMMIARFLETTGVDVEPAPGSTMADTMDRLRNRS
jgi:alkylhydroperoxidase family enzyme